MYAPTATRRWNDRTWPFSAWWCGLVLLVVMAGGVLRAVAMDKRGGRVLEQDGVRYVALKDLAGLLGGAYARDGEDLVLRHSQGRFVFSPGTRRARFRDQVVWLHREPVRLGRRWAITEADADVVVGPLLRPGPVLARVGRDTVMLDPGHGGRDEGARGLSARPEKELTLDLARRVRGRLERAGCRVVLTRDGDRYLALEERSRMALARRADVFVSLHFNQAANPEASGIEVFALAAQGQPSTLDQPGQSVPAGAFRGHVHQAAGTVLGARIQEALLLGVQPQDRGLRRARFAVLKNAPCPAALAECGFLSHPDEAAAIASDRHMDRLADAVAEGIRAYLDAARAARERATQAAGGTSPPA